MILFGDYHSHTVFSDGRGTMEQSVIAAKEKGLKQLAFTEHGYDHMAHGMKRKNIPAYKKMMQELRNKHKELTILYGIEANILSLKGEIDVTKQEQGEFDVLIVGFHKSYKPTSVRNFFNFWLPNNLPILRSRKKQIAKNTQAYIKAMKTHDIDILAHLNYGGCLVNSVEIAKVAIETNTYIELNGKRILFTDEELLEMTKLGTKFIVDSDAHYPERVGKNHKAFNLIERLHIPHEQVVNLDKLPDFKNFKQQ